MSLEVRNLKKIYRKPFSRKPPFVAVKDVSFSIRPGEIYALLGPNGAGKSTIIKMIAGLIVPTSGEIKLDSNEGRSESLAAYKKLSAVLEGTRNIYWRLTPMENLHYFSNLRGKSSSEVSAYIETLLSSFEIEGKKKNQSQHMSRGMLQKLAFAAALVTDPQILLLDEPTLGLDVASGRRIKEIIIDLAKNHKKTILLTTHQMDLVEEIADRVGIIREGSLVKEGTIPELRSLFKSHIYKIRIAGKFKPDAAFTKKFSVRVAASTSEFTDLEADCKNTAGVYSLAADLGRKKKEILSLEKSTEDLEEIFLRVLA